MHNLSDQELDHLSKEAADNFESAPGPAMWDKIQKRLDVEMPVQKKEKRRFFWLFSLSGLLLLTLMIGIELNNGSVQISEVIKSDVSVSGITKKTIPAEKENNKNINLADSKESKIELPLPGTDISIVPVLDHVYQQKKDKVQIDKPLKKSSVRSLKLSGKTQNGEELLSSGQTASTGLLKQTESDLSNKKILEPAGQAENKVIFKTDDTTDGKQHEKGTAGILQSAATDSVHKNQNLSETENQTNASALNPTIKSKQLNRFELSGVFGPDFSNVGFVSPEKTGINLGLMVGFQLSERFSIQTGLLHSSKHYTAVGEAYKGYPGINMNNTYVKMDWVDANCLMWDIPINVRYNWLLRPKQRAFVSAGLSSYIIKEEDLQYHFRYYGDPGYRAWTNQKATSYWLSVVNFSIGYEQRISPSFSIQAEPFVKLPAQEIGYGNINLNSLGLFLSIKYTPAPFLFKFKKTR